MKILRDSACPQREEVLNVRDLLNRFIVLCGVDRDGEMYGLRMIFGDVVSF